MNKIIASGTLAAVLLTALPVFADSGNSGKEEDNGLHLGQFINASIKDRLQIALQAKVHEDNDMDEDGGIRATSTATATRERHGKREGFFERMGRATAGIVTSVDGALFTVDPFGAKSTTAVTTDASTTFKVRGQATTSAALTTGAHVIVIGSTTATSTSGDNISASLVIIIRNGWGHLRHWLHF